MSKAISNDVSSTITLTASYDPLLITSTGSVETTAKAAIYGNASQAWHITNDGYIENTGQFAIELQSGSTVTNAFTISDTSSGGEAIRINGGAGLVTNSAIITGNYDGVVLTAGGTVTNSSGAVTGTHNDGVYISGGAGTVTNAGRITGGKYAVQFHGSFADRLIIDAGAVFTGKIAGGSGSNTLELAAGRAGTTGTLTGLGSNYTGFGTVAVDGGASWKLDSTSTVAYGVALTDAGTLANAGLINAIVTLASGGTFSNTGFVDNHTIAYGVSLLGSGVVNNGLGGATGADITGYQDGILANGGAATIANAGTIYGIDSYGVALSKGGSVGNSGAIRTFGDGVAISGGAGTVTNSGSISAYYNGVQMTGGGVVTNTGTIETTANVGVYIGGGSATVTNAGQIVTTKGSYAVQFAGSFADRVIIDPGALFTGVVQGGSGSNTLELAADPHGATGTLTGFASEFRNFGTIAVDSGAKWQMDATDTIASGSVVTDAGTLASFGVIDATVSVASAGSFANNGTVNAGSGQIGITLLAGGAVSNASFAKLVIEGSRYGIRAQGGAATITNGSTIIGTSSLNGGGIGLYAGGTVTNTGTIIGDGAAGIYIGGGAGTVTNAGSIGGVTDAIKFSGSFADRVIVKPGAVFRGKVQGGAGTNTLELAAGSASATGTLANFASSFAGFGGITVDQAAVWQFAANDTIASATSVTDNGTLKNAGVIDGPVTVSDGGSLANSGTIADTPQTAGVLLLEGSRLTNSGLIEHGCYVESGIGTVSNSGSIEGSFGGVVMFHGGMVTNTGQIAATADTIDVEGVRIEGGAGVVTNTSGLISGYYDGVVLTAGGAVVNTASIYAHANTAVYIGGGAGTVTNAGTLTAGYRGCAVQFSGSFADRMILDPGAIINGTVQGASGTNTLELAAKAGSPSAIGILGNFATGFDNFGTIDIDSGATWRFAVANTVGSTATVSDSGVLNNAGEIDGSVTITAGNFGNSGTVGTASAGITMISGGTLTNVGLIDAMAYVKTGIGHVTNTGTIDGPFAGVVMAAGGTVTNTGLITDAGNEAGGIGVQIENAAGLVSNNGGTITGVNEGVLLTSGGSVVNKGLISGILGIGIAGGAGTITNAGTITGSGNLHVAVQFGTGNSADRLIFDAGATFIGTVQGGGSNSTLELAAGSAGVIGTLSAFANSFTNFGTIGLDSNANWAVAANSTIGSSVAFTDAGNLANSGLIDTEVSMSRATNLRNTGTINGGGMQQGVVMAAGGLLNNSGIVEGTNGVSVAGAAGYVIDSGKIYGAFYGVDMAAGGTVRNAGTIDSTSHGIAVQIGGAAGTLINTASIIGSFDGVALTSGGTLQNSGTIYGGGNFGVYIGGGNGTVTNSGTISGGTAAVEFSGNFNDHVNFDAGAKFDGAVKGGSGFNVLELAAGRTGVIGTLSNFSNNFVGFNVIDIDYIASWKNASGSTIGSGIAIVDAGSFSNAGVIDSGVTITSAAFSNSGTIDGGTYGVFLPNGGTLTNTGLIEGNSGVTLRGVGGGTLINSGTISSNAAYSYAVNSENALSINNTGLILGWNALVDATGPVTNSGTVAGGGYGIELGHGGTITNTSTGRIYVTGNRTGDQAIFITGGAGTLTNAGTITSDSVGVALAQGGVVSNTGSIGGTAIGIAVSGGGTITDAGTISGGTFAVTFGGFIADRMILDPGAVLSGTVQGGSGSNTLELAATNPAATGTLANLGSQFPAFGRIAEDAGANWVVTATNPFAGEAALPAVSLQSGALLTFNGGGALAAAITGAGTLQLAGSTGFSFTAADTLGSTALTIDSGATLSGNGSIASALSLAGSLAASSGTLKLGGALSGAGDVSAAQGATVDILGGASFSGTLAGSGSFVVGSALTLGAGAMFSASSIVDTASIAIAAGANLQNAAGGNVTLSAASGHTLTVAGGAGSIFTNAGSVTAAGSGVERIAASASFTNTGVVTASAGTLAFLGNVSNHGTIDAASGLVSFQTSVGNAGTLEIGATGTLSLALGAGTGQSVDFLSGTGLLGLASPTSFNGTISGFATGDKIDLLNTLETSYTYANNILTVKNATTTVAALHFTGTSNSFSLTSDAHGGTFIVFT